MQNRGRQRQFLSMAARAFVGLVAASLIAGCTVFPFDHGTRANQPIGDGIVETRASEAIAPEALPLEPSGSGRVFIGITLSGGGSRAANFSAAALLELERMGILRHSAVISSVSGGSLAAAYFGVEGDNSARWNEPELRRRLGHDFRGDWIVRWLYPHNLLRFWFTPFDRADIMKQVLDDALFDGRTCRMTDMNRELSRADQCNSYAAPGGKPKLPHIVINASDLLGNNFTFTSERFLQLRSRIDTYPVTHAVMASAAFPGAFNNVTLENYEGCGEPRKRCFQHLMDGGPTDNLGVKAVRRAIERVQRQLKGNLAACLLVIVDSFADPEGRPQREQEYHDQRLYEDPRRVTDYFFDDNLVDALDNLLFNARSSSLTALGMPTGKRPGEAVTWQFSSKAGGSLPVNCLVWHVTFQRLVSLAESHTPAAPGSPSGRFCDHPQGDLRCLAQRVNAMKTDFRLVESVHPNTSEERTETLNSPERRQELQDLLYRAAGVLMQEDSESRNRVMEWVHRWLGARP